MTKGFLSFDFNDVKVNTGPGIGDIPTGVPLYGTVDKVTLETFNGNDKFVFHQTIFLDEERSVAFKTYIGNNHAWLVAQYLDAAGEDFRSLSGQGLSAEALETVLTKIGFQFTFKESTYPGRDGQPRTSKQITTVRPAETE